MKKHFYNNAYNYSKLSGTRVALKPESKVGLLLPWLNSQMIFVVDLIGKWIKKSIWQNNKEKQSENGQRTANVRKFVHLFFNLNMIY